jgi:hypothetical protein
MARLHVTVGPAARVLAGVMAAATLVGGYAHLSLYNDGYRDIPVGNIGPQFLLNAIGGAAIAAGLVAAVVFAVLPRLVALGAAAGGVLWGAISMVAFFVARTSGGWFGFTDQPGLKPSPEAAMSVFSEGVAVLCGLLLLARLLVPTRPNADSS